MKRVCGTDEWICIHCNPEDTEAFEVGIISRVTTSLVVFHAMDTRGRDNGSRSVTFEHIMGVTIGGSYIENLKVYRSTLESVVSVTPQEDGHEGMLRAAQTAGLTVSLRLPDETLQGYVREVGEGWTAIATIDSDEGLDSGLQIVSLEDAERVFVGGEDEMMLAALFRARQMRDSIG